MTLSTLTGLTDIVAGSGATTGLFNSRFQILEKNVSQVRADLIALPASTDTVTPSNVTAGTLMLSVANTLASPKTVRADVLMGALARLQGVHIVTDPKYGAVGDGVTDDTDAIDATLTAGAGKTIIFPAGTYKRTTPLDVPANTTIVCHGVVTINASSVSGAVVNIGDGAGGRDNIRILGPLRITGTADKVMHVNNAQSVFVEDMWASGGTFTDGFVFYSTWDSSFHRLKTNGSTISGSCFETQNEVNGCYFGHVYTSNDCSQNIHINGNGHGNVLDSATAQGGAVGVYVHKADPGGWTFNSPYTENAGVPFRFGEYNVSACWGITVNAPYISGPLATNSGYSTRKAALWFDNALGVVVNTPMFATLTATGMTTATPSDGTPTRACQLFPRVKTDGTIDSLVVLDPGDGYVGTPTITISGAGTGATATATVTSGAVTSVSVTTAGSGYTPENCPLIALMHLAFSCEIKNPRLAATGYSPMPVYALVAAASTGMVTTSSFRITGDHSLRQGVLTPCDVVRGKGGSGTGLFILERDSAGAEVVTAHTMPAW